MRTRQTRRGAGGLTSWTAVRCSSGPRPIKVDNRLGGLTTGVERVEVSDPLNAISDPCRDDEQIPDPAASSRQTPSARALLRFCKIGTISMPLMPSEVLRFDADRMAFEFTMLDSEGETVRCQISGAAMDELAGTRGTPPDERKAQFMSLRDKIERIASERFDQDGIIKGAVVRIFTKHIQTDPHLSNHRNDEQQ